MGAGATGGGRGVPRPGDLVQPHLGFRGAFRILVHDEPGLTAAGGRPPLTGVAEREREVRELIAAYESGVESASDGGQGAL
ncbi:hypothetical protein ACFWIB_16490 [Streptomyces sp. NPDC127051]|uniref:hypothetical protein n=1 Tax=Streptomyces sp. NPDC127051 TaxID=3347119 RepID=UPI00365EE4CA